MTPKLGEIIYPSFDGFWRQNRHLVGHAAWRPIEFVPARKPGEAMTRIFRVDDYAATAGFDNRMSGKLTATTGRVGVVCIVSDTLLLPVTVDRKIEMPGGSVRNVRCLVLNPPDDVWALKITRALENVVIAEPVRIDKLP